MLTETVLPAGGLRIYWKEIQGAEELHVYCHAFGLGKKSGIFNEKLLNFVFILV